MSTPASDTPSGSEPLAGLDPERLAQAGLTPDENPPPLVPEGLAERLAQLLPDYRILDCLGRGGMGVVFRARQLKLDREVAIKVLLPAPGETAGWSERFEREARALARLNHPGIVGVHDFGQVEDLHYLILEYVEGASLRELLSSGALGADEALAIVPQICEALQYAHDEGIVHRDVKPENILLNAAGRVKITDFGLAKLSGDQAFGNTLTGTQQALGTLRYMAPEQIEQPREVDHRADIYSLGIVFYEMLTGEVPAGSFRKPSERSGVDARLDRVVLRAMERERERRYQKAADVRRQVSELASTPAAEAPAANPDAKGEEEAEPAFTGLAAGIGMGSLKGLKRLIGDDDDEGPSMSELSAKGVPIAEGVFTHALCVLGIVLAGLAELPQGDSVWEFGDDSFLMVGIILAFVAPIVGFWCFELERMPAAFDAMRLAGGIGLAAVYTLFLMLHDHRLPASVIDGVVMYFAIHGALAACFVLPAIWRSIRRLQFTKRRGLSDTSLRRMRVLSMAFGAAGAATIFMQWRYRVPDEGGHWFDYGLLAPGMMGMLALLRTACVGRTPGNFEASASLILSVTALSVVGFYLIDESYNAAGGPAAAGMFGALLLLLTVFEFFARPA